MKKAKSKNGKIWFRSVIVALICFAITMVLQLTGVFSFFENKTYDRRMVFASKYKKACDEISFIIVDQDSIDWATENYEWGWPWPREAYGKMIDFITAGNARSVAFDIIYTEPSVYGESDDEALALAEENSGIAGRFDEVARLSREAVDAVLGFSLAHIGVNCGDEAEAMADAERFDLLFGFTKKDGNSSVFAGSVAEFMKTPYLGAKGHIAIGTTNVERAVFHLTLRGVQFDMDTAKYDTAGRLKAVYMTDEISGFAVHLVQK